MRSDDAVEDLPFLFGPALHQCDNVINILVVMGKDIQGMGWTLHCIGGIGNVAAPWHGKQHVDKGVHQVCQYV